MKNVILAFTVYTVLVLSCNFSSNEQATVNPMIGKWKIDSLSSKDSFDFGALLIAMSLKDRDSISYDLLFSQDTVLFLQKDTATKTAYHFKPETKELLLLEDSTLFSYQLLNDSSVTLTTKDSVVLFLKKK